jgi:hypothetical protein
MLGRGNGRKGVSGATDRYRGGVKGERAGRCAKDFGRGPVNRKKRKPADFIGEGRGRLPEEDGQAMFLIRHKRSRMRRLISVYLDGELDKERQRELFSHLEVCPECREEMAAQRALTSIVGRALAQEDVPDILADVLTALERKRERRSHGLSSVFSWSPRPALAYAAAAALGIALGILIFSGTGTTTAAVSDPLPIAYLSEKPPNSLITFYLGDTVGDTNE